MEGILKHELMSVPLSLAQTNGTLRSGDKSVLADELIGNIECPSNIQIYGSSCLIIDGQALVRAIGKPPKANTFGDLANEYITSIMEMGTQFNTIDVVFDRYDDVSIKDGTRDKKHKKSKKIRRVVVSGDVPLPKYWDSFI